MSDKVPNCSTCGLVVEWVRSSYKGTWHLFRDNPALKTVGRYYFAPEGTPHAGFPHFLGSRSWHDTNHPNVVTLGEDLSTPEHWDDGALPAVLPLPIVSGDVTCLTTGELADRAISISDLRDGFPPGCFRPSLPTFLPWVEVSAVDRCSVQRLFARVIDWMYQNEDLRIVGLLREWIGTAATVVFHREAGLMPAVTTVITPKYQIVVLDGTRNFTQLALQGFQSVRRPVDRGIFGTVKLWFDAADYVHGVLMADGGDAVSPTFVVGHSYGGAVAMCLLGIYAHASETRELTYLTYGCPKAGDARLADLIRRCRGLKLANDSDIVTVFPPSPALLEPFVGIYGYLLLAVWFGWVKMGRNLRIDDLGVAVETQEDVADYEVIRAMLADVFQGNLILSVNGHPITEYLRRLQLRCPGVEWPIDADVDDLIDEPEDFRIAGAGDLLVGGSAVMGSGIALAGAGDLLVGGSAGLVSGIALAGAGDVLVGGNASMTFRLDVETGLNIQAGGSSENLVDVAMPGPGELLVGGSSENLVDVAMTGRGELLVGGSAVMAYDPGGVAPGNTCATAYELAMDGPETFDLGSMSTHWFHAELTGLDGYHVKITVNSGSDPLTTFRVGVGCGALFDQSAFNGTGCMQNLFALPTGIYVQVDAGVFGGCNYTIEVGNGPCP